MPKIGTPKKISKVATYDDMFKQARVSAVT